MKTRMTTTKTMTFQSFLEESIRNPLVASLDVGQRRAAVKSALSAYATAEQGFVVVVVVVVVVCQVVAPLLLLLLATH
jgi:hypothetical protein